MSGKGQGGVPCRVANPMMHVMYLPPPTSLWTDRRLWKHYLPANSFASGNNTDESLFDFTIYKFLQKKLWLGFANGIVLLDKLDKMI